MRQTATFRELAGLPKLAWLASLELGTGALDVLHGSAVERGEDGTGAWLVEGVWDGDFARGEFHRSENFFGSGVRLTGDAVHFVASTALVDRLLYAVWNGTLFVSNSLPLLLARTGARLDPSHDYGQETYAILAGIRRYRREFTVRHPEIDALRQVFAQNIVVREGRLEIEDRLRVREIDSYDEYLGLLRGALGAIALNAASPLRRHRVARFATVSSGYDSPAVATLARELGTTTAFTSRRSASVLPAWLNSDAAVDDGTPIAVRLGYETIHLDPKPGHLSEDELYFLAATSAEPEVVFHSMARHIALRCDVAMVFTGYHGDKMWDAHVHGHYLSDEVIRGDTSGLNLSEIRLKAGFFNVAVPFMYARSIRSIAAISTSPELLPWRVHTDYDRPIPRRIVETAGVPRELFGVRKKAAIRFYGYPANARLRRAFMADFRRRYARSPGFVYAHQGVNKLAFLALGTVDKVVETVTGRPRETPKQVFYQEYKMPLLMHVWALTELAERTREVLRAEGALEATPSLSRRRESVAGARPGRAAADESPIPRAS